MSRFRAGRLLALATIVALTAILSGLPALCLAQPASGAPAVITFATFDTDVAICAKNEPGRRTEFRRRLDPVRACGRVESKAAAEVRASATYKREVQRQLHDLAEDRASRAQITIYCDTALANVEKFCARSGGEKQR